MQIISHSEYETKVLAENIAKNLTTDNFIIYLNGNLGAGKTTFARNFIQFFGFDKVKSPTYSIVEPYEGIKNIYHFDLYRLSDFEELEMLGVREYFDKICLIEWADNLAGLLPQPDLEITITGEIKRTINLSAKTDNGEILLKNL